MSTLRTEREELDYQYSPSRWSTRLKSDVIVAVHDSVLFEATKVARNSVKCDLGIEYLEPGGPKLDIYYPQPNSGGTLSDAVFLYFHGGYWIDLGVDWSGHCAIPLTKNGATMVAVGHTLANKVNLTTVVEQCKKAVLYVKKKFDQKRIFVAGHCSGAHLATTMMITDWKQYGLETQPFSGAILTGGVYDLRPLQKMYVNDTVKFTDKEVQELSPQLQADKLKGLPAGFPCLVAWGEEESTEFKRQSKDFIQKLQDSGAVCKWQEMAGKDHFQVSELLQNEDDDVMKMILDLMSQ